MKFLCLAYGDEKGWNSLTESEKEEALAQDEAIRSRGNFMTALHAEVVSVRNRDKNLEIKGTMTPGELPLAGFSIIEAGNVNEVIELVSKTPCARAKGYIEIRSFRESEIESA